MSVLIRCWGDFALFTRPEMKVERVSYDVMTPSAARGILDAIYWHDGVKWIVEEIYVRKPVKFASIRRNELKSLMNTKGVLTAIQSDGVLPTVDTDADRTQRAALVLKDVEYYIKAYAKVDEAVYGGPKAKADAIIMQRLQRGGCYHHPYFGCREFPVQFELVDEVPPCPEGLLGDMDLNWMLWDWDYQYEQPKPIFFRPMMHDGRIVVPERGDLP